HRQQDQRDERADHGAHSGCTPESFTMLTHFRPLLGDEGGKIFRRAGIGDGAELLEAGAGAARPSMIAASAAARRISLVSLAQVLRPAAASRIFTMSE